MLPPAKRYFRVYLYASGVIDWRAILDVRANSHAAALARSLNEWSRKRGRAVDRAFVTNNVDPGRGYEFSVERQAWEGMPSCK